MREGIPNIGVAKHVCNAQSINLLINYGPRKPRNGGLLWSNPHAYSRNLWIRVAGGLVHVYIYIISTWTVRHRLWLWRWSTKPPAIPIVQWTECRFTYNKRKCHAKSATRNITSLSYSLPSLNFGNMACPVTWLPLTEDSRINHRFAFHILHRQSPDPNHPCRKRLYEPVQCPLQCRRNLPLHGLYTRASMHLQRLVQPRRPM